MKTQCSYVGKNEVSSTKCCGAINVVLLKKERKKEKKLFDKGFYFHCLTATAGPQEPNTTQSDVALNTAENNLTE